jgi:hypothetical protein
MTPKAQQTLADPKFYQLPPAEQQRALAMMDADYAGLPLEERNKVLQMGQQRLGSASTVPAPTNTIRPLADQERFSDLNLYPVGVKGEGVGENLKNLAQRGGVGIYQLAQAAMNPGATVRGMVSSVLPDPIINLLNKLPGPASGKSQPIPTGTPNPLEQAYKALQPGGWQAAGNVAPVAGQALATAGVGEAAPAIALDILKYAKAVAPKLADAAAATARAPVSLLRIGMQDLGGAGKEPVARAIRKDAANSVEAQKSYEDALSGVQGKNKDTRADYVGKEIAARRSEATQAAAKAQKQVIERGQEAYVTRAMANARETFKTVKARLDARFNVLRDKIGDQSIGDGSVKGKPIGSDAIEQSIEQAKDKFLMGSPESLAQFNNLMNTMTEETPPSIPFGKPEVKIRPLSWQEARVHYTALGDKLYSGGLDALPGNVRKAIGMVRDTIDEQLERVAKANKLDKFYRSAQDDWGQFKKDWDDMSNLSYSKGAMNEAGSPLARLVRAADPKTAARALANDRIMEQLARYRAHGSNLNLAKGFRALDSRLDGIDKVTLSKHPPKFEPDPEPTPPDTSASKSPAQIRYEKLEQYAGRPWRWYDVVPFNLFERLLLKSNDIRQWVAEQPRNEIPIERQITK